MTKLPYRVVNAHISSERLSRLNRRVAKLEGRADRVIQRIRNIEKIVGRLPDDE